MNSDVNSYSLGFSPCPNDTFIFYALVHDKLPAGHLHIAAPHLEDVETLNLWAMHEKLDISKISFHAYGHVCDKYVLLSSGSALGRGCGPLLVCRSDKPFDPATAKIAVPGQYTTAAMLLHLYCPGAKNISVLRFDKILPALQSGVIDAGVIIHESRFTYQNFRVRLIKDLGSWWEETTGHPIPLGGIAARRSLGDEIICQISQTIKASVQWAFANRQNCMSYIKQYAQELDDSVIAGHIDLYVNHFTEDLQVEGEKAIEEFLRRGTMADLFDLNFNKERRHII